MWIQVLKTLPCCVFVEVCPDPEDSPDISSTSSSSTKVGPNPLPCNV